MAVIADVAPDRVLVESWVWLANAHSQLNDMERALALIERASPTPSASGWSTSSSTGCARRARSSCSRAGRSKGEPSSKPRSRSAERAGAGLATVRSAFNLSLALFDEDPRAAVEMGRRTVELARRFGLASLRLVALMNTAEVSVVVGDWGWIEAELATIDPDDLESGDRAALATARAELAAIRGRDGRDGARRPRRVAGDLHDPQTIAAGASGWASSPSRKAGSPTRSARSSRRRPTISTRSGALIIRGRAAARLGDRGGARDALDRLAAITSRGTAQEVQRDALAACVAALEGRWPEAVAGFTDAWRRYRDLRMDVGLAVSQLDCLAVAPAGDPLAEIAVREAREILEREGAGAYLRQLDTLVAERASAGRADTSRTAAHPGVPADATPA